MSSTSSTSIPRYSVVIVTYNSRDNIQLCLDSLRRCSGSGDHEVIVVDNASRDATPDYLAKMDGDGLVRALLCKENHGFSKGCNLGAAKARGEFLVFLNPDTLATPGWTDAMAQYFQDPGVGAAGPLSNYVAGLQRLDLHVPAPYGKGKRFPGGTAVEQSENVARILKEANQGRGITTKLLIGFCLMMRRSLFEEMGGMDEKLFLGNDDLDLSWRLRNRGLKLVVATDAFVFHEGQKSFQTEKKSHVDRLVQESTDALYLKLVDHYGGRDKVPSPDALWGMNWFTPSPALTRGDTPSPNSEARMATDNRTTTASTAWKGVTTLIYVGPGQAGPAGESERLDRTLSTLPANPSDVVLLNCSGWSGPIARQPEGSFRRLDLGAATSPRAAIELATALAQDHVLFCAAGVGFTSLFNHWLEKRLGALPTALPLSIRADGDAAPADAAYPGCAFLCRKAWLREALGSIPAHFSGGQPAGDAAAFLSALGGKVAAAPAEKPGDAPWLLARPSDLPVAPVASAAASGSWTPVQDRAPAPAAAAAGKWDEALRAFPESLAGPMRGATDIAFAGTVAEPLPVKGPFHVFDMKGDRVLFQDHDLVILRLSADLVDSLPERLANLRRQGKGLKRLLLVLNSKQALGRPRPDGMLAAIDVTAEGARAALWQAGFAVASEKPYTGLPPVPGAVGDLTGWSLIEAVPRSPAHLLAKKVSIVILGFNQVEYTKKCIESIRKHTKQAYELILVDNGSKDGTEEFFRSVPGAKVIRNATNQGVSKGWNQGMRLADGDYFLIFNNDTIVGPGWLENMVRLCESDPSIGMVGPRSNYIAGPQIVKPVPYKTEAGIQDFIASWQKDHDLAADEFGFIKGFCLLFPREVFRKVGFFDERFGKGNFEDDDYCMRVRYHGWRTLIAHDSFIHHYGSVSFNQEDTDWKALMVENQKKYVEKWSRGAAAVNDTVVSEPAEPAGPAWSPAPATVPKLSGAPAAPATKPAPAPVPAHLPEIDEARRAYESGDINAARRLFLDAQARLPDHPEAYCGLGVIAFHEGANMDAGTLFLRCLELDGAHADAARNLMDVLAVLEDGLPAGDVVSLAARFPANPAFRESLAAIQAEQAAAAAPAPRALPAWRQEVEAWIGRREYAPAIDAVERRLKAGQDAGACYNYMGVIAHACGDQAFAAENFRLALKQGPAEADTVYNLMDTLLATGRVRDALELLEHPPAMDAAAADAAEMAATAEQIRHALESGSPDAARLMASRDANLEAEALLRAGTAAAAKGKLDAVLAADPGDFRALNNLGLAEWYLGRHEEAWQAFDRCLAIRPCWTDALVNGFDAALAAGRMDAMKERVAKALRLQPAHPEARRMEGHIGREGGAIGSCRSFEALEADSAVLAKADKAIQEGRKGDAIYAYLESIESRPQNPQALNGLGIIAFSEQRHVDAYALFDAAAALHPMDQDILVNLWQAAQALRREGDVRPRLKASLERNPALHDVKAILESA